MSRDRMIRPSYVKYIKMEAWYDIEQSNCSLAGQAAWSGTVDYFHASHKVSSTIQVVLSA